MEKNWNGLTARVHWVAFTARCPLRETMDDVTRTVYTAVADDVPASFRDLPHGGNGYARCSVGPYGVRVYSSPDRDDHHVVIPGAACDVMTTRCVLALFEPLGRVYTRVDVALDGVVREGEPLRPSFVHWLCREQPDQVRTRVKLGAPPDATSGRRPENLMLVCGTNGDTCYLGSKDSERILRVYDSRGFTRMELQASGDRAAQLAEVLDGKHPIKFGRAVVGYLRGFVDFVKPRSASNKRTAPLADWWQAVVGDADRVMPALPEHRPHLDLSFQTFRRQWQAMAATFIKASGGDMTLFDQLVMSGVPLLGARHDAMIAEAGGAGNWQPRWDN